MSPITRDCFSSHALSSHLAINGWRPLFIAALLSALASLAWAEPEGQPWERLPPTPVVGSSATYRYLQVNGEKLAYMTFGFGSPVIVLHGGAANLNYLGKQIDALKFHHQVIALDTRGHGRSSWNGAPLVYEQMADDVAALMSALGIDRADFLGWREGAVTALDLAMRYPDKVRRVVAFGANVMPDGVFNDFASKTVFADFMKRAAEEYRQLSPAPARFDKLNKALATLQRTQPNWNTEQLQRIKAPVLVIDGDHDEVIRPEHTEYIAHSLPKGTLLFIENASHFAFLQKPKTFNKAMLEFLESDNGENVTRAGAIEPGT